jgi:methionyl-tRNA synthetase
VAAVWTLVEEANRCIDRTRPWELAKAGRDGELDAALAALVRACRELVKELAPFLPGAAARLAELLAADPATGRLPVSRPPFTRLGPDKS